MSVLSEISFIITETDVIDENENDILIDVEYEQLLQINYIGKTSIGDTKNFENMISVKDEKGYNLKINPRIEYSKIFVVNMNSFVVALKNKSDKVKIEIFYSGVMSPNDIVEITANDLSQKAPEIIIPDKNDTNNLVKKQAVLEKMVSDLEQKIIDKNKIIDDYKKGS